MDIPKHPHPDEYPNIWNSLPGLPAVVPEIELPSHPESATEPPPSSPDTTLIPPPTDRGSSPSEHQPLGGPADSPDITVPLDRRPPVEAQPHVAAALPLLGDGPLVTADTVAEAARLTDLFDTSVDQSSTSKASVNSTELPESDERGSGETPADDKTMTGSRSPRLGVDVGRDWAWEAVESEGP